MTPNIREQLKLIQSELREPLAANKHKVRDLPGTSKKWVYLPHQTIRERLDEVCPEWVIDYSEIQYFGNDAICRAAITILGVRKEAIASVPLSILSSNNKEMTRGSAADRLAAEAIRNSSEQWGIGRYLDDQEFTIRYLWQHRHELSQEMQEEVQRLTTQYKIQQGFIKEPVRQKTEGSILHSMSGTNPGILISEKQCKRLWAIAKNELKLDDTTIKAVQQRYGFNKTEDITVDQYESVIEFLRSVQSQPREGTATGSADEPWKNWKKLGDAIAWAQSQLPTYSAKFLQGEFDRLEATNGKKAPTWVRRVQELKQDI